MTPKICGVFETYCYMTYWFPISDHYMYGFHKSVVMTGVTIHANR